jgi:hypothetical protein
MEDSPLQTKQETLANLHTLAVPDLNEEPPSPDIIGKVTTPSRRPLTLLGTKNARLWSPRHDSQVCLISPQSSSSRTSLLQGPLYNCSFISKCTRNDSYEEIWARRLDQDD